MARTERDVVADALREQILTGLHVGRLSGGDRLPPARALAAEFGVNERVVLAALHALAEDGFVTLRTRSGAYVAPPHPAGGPRLPDLGAWLVSMLVQARTRGLPPRDVSEYVRRCLETRRVRAACIECNRDQLDLICTELSGDHGFVAEGAEVDDLEADEPPLAVRRADVLVTTTFHAAEVQAAAERLGKPWIVVALRPNVMDDVARALRVGPVYYVATDPRFEPKIRRTLEGLAPVDDLHVLLVDRDDLDAIPADAPTFVMPAARAPLAARYGERRGPGRPIHPPRVFSDDAARELLTFLVRANLASVAAGVAG